MTSRMTKRRRTLTLTTFKLVATVLLPSFRGGPIEHSSLPCLIFRHSSSFHRSPFNPLYAKKIPAFFTQTCFFVFCFCMFAITRQNLGLLDVTLSSLSNPFGPTTVLGVGSSSTHLLRAVVVGETSRLSKIQNQILFYSYFAPCLFRVCLRRVPCPICLVGLHCTHFVDLD